MSGWSLSVLLLGVMLVTVAALDSEEQQKENKEHLKVSLEPGEGPPVNVIATPVGATALNVSWDPPETAPQYYTVDVTTIFNAETSDTFSLIDELESCQYYAVVVSSVYYDGVSSPSFGSGTTNAPVPPAPDSCSLTLTSSSTVTVSWHDPALECGTFDHDIKWSWDVLWSDEQGSDETFSSETSITIPDLSPYTSLTVNVAVISTGGAGQPTSCSMTTPEEAPGPPNNLQLEQEATSITATWDPPQEMNGVIMGYLVMWDDGEGHPDEATLDNLARSYTIQNLTRCLEYTVSVSANTSTGWGADAQSTTSIPNYLPVDALECYGNESRGVDLVWSLESPDCQVAGFTLSWNTTVEWSNQQDEDNITLSGAVTNYSIADLEPYTEVNACLVVDGVEGEWSCCSTTTLEEVPGPPVNLSLEVDQTSLRVSWGYPEEKNGEIIAFTISWEDLEGDSYNETVDADVLSYTIEPIIPCVEYNVTVTASTSAGPGAGAQDLAIIPNYLSRVSCINSVNRQISVTWSLAEPECTVPNYILAWNATVLWGSNQQDSKTETVNGTWTDAVIPSLEPYTRVDACLSVGGQEQAPRCCSATTLQEPASEPTNLQMVNKSRTWAEVSWAPPEHLNGVQTSWHLTWHTGSSIVNESDIALGINKRVITDLQPDTNYLVSLQARNVAGLGAQANISFITLPGIQSKSNVGVIVGASVGGVVLLVLLVGGFTFYFTRRYNRSDDSDRSGSVLENRDQQYVRRESQAFGGRRPSGANNGSSVNGDVYQGGRRPSQAQYAKRMSQASVDPWKGPSQALGARKYSQAYLEQRRQSQAPSTAGILGDSHGQRRPSQAPSTAGILDDSHGQRRPSQAPSTAGILDDSHGQRRPSHPTTRTLDVDLGQRRPSHPTTENIDVNHGQRRPSQVPTASGSDYTHYGERRKSQVGDARRNSEAYPGLRRSSQAPAPGRLGPGHSGPRRASEAAIGKDIEKNYLPRDRRASAAPGVGNREGPSYLDHRRASAAPGVGNREGPSYLDQRRASAAPGVGNREGPSYLDHRRASAAPGVGNREGPSYLDHRRASAAPGVGNRGNPNFPGQRRASEMPGRSYYEMQSYPKQ
ncbi:neogenin [Procambarus clarkii]|uniref:neogenin n=1 Tax=Procambarus clarkii TaxID=6728 RepID=UPI003742E573